MRTEKQGKQRKKATHANDPANQVKAEQEKIENQIEQEQQKAEGNN